MEAVVGERKVWIDFQLQQFPCQLLSTVGTVYTSYANFSPLCVHTLLIQEPLFKISFNTMWTGVLLQWTCMIDWLIYSGIDIYKLWMSSHTMLTRENCVDLNFVFQFRQISILCAIFFPFQQIFFFACTIFFPFRQISLSCAIFWKSLFRVRHLVKHFYLNRHGNLGHRAKWGHSI